MGTGVGIGVGVGVGVRTGVGVGIGVGVEVGIGAGVGATVAMAVGVAVDLWPPLSPSHPAAKNMKVISNAGSHVWSILFLRVRRCVGDIEVP